MNFPLSLCVQICFSFPLYHRSPHPLFIHFAFCVHFLLRLSVNVFAKHLNDVKSKSKKEKKKLKANEKHSEFVCLVWVQTGKNGIYVNKDVSLNTDEEKKRGKLVKIDEKKPKLMDFNASLDYSITVCLSIEASDFPNSLIPIFSPILIFVSLWFFDSRWFFPAFMSVCLCLFWISCRECDKIRNNEAINKSNHKIRSPKTLCRVFKVR